jgi:hypothetical protein
MAFFAGFGGLMEIRAWAPEMVSKAAGENRGGSWANTFRRFSLRKDKT